MPRFAWPALLLSLPFTLGACQLLIPSASIEAAHMAAVGATSLVTLKTATPENVIRHEDLTTKFVCIEYNKGVELPDLVPAIQIVLKELGTESRVYEYGMLPRECDTVLNYSATLDWGTPPLQNDYKAYMNSALLSLRRANGQIVATANYRPGFFNGDRWSSTERKIRPVVQALLQVPGKGTATIPATKPADHR